MENMSLLKKIRMLRNLSLADLAKIMKHVQSAQICKLENFPLRGDRKDERIEHMAKMIDIKPELFYYYFGKFPRKIREDVSRFPYFYMVSIEKLYKMKTKDKKRLELPLYSELNKEKKNEEK